MALLFIVLSVTCSLAIAQILKMAENRKMRVLNILVVNYIAGSLISFLNSREIAVFPDSELNIGGWLIGSILILGLIFIANMVV